MDRQEITEALSKWSDDIGLFPEIALPCKSCDRNAFNSTTFLGDTGASTHVIGADDGLFDYEEIDEAVIIGDGKELKATKIGKLRQTVHQADGSTLDIVLEEVKCVPGLDMPLFGMLKALSQGCKMRNEGTFLTLYKNKMSITFDRVLRTKNGKLVGVSLLPRDGDNRKEVAMPATTDSSSTTWDINRTKSSTMLEKKLCATRLKRMDGRLWELSKGVKPVI